MNIANKIKHYLGNPHLKKVGTTQQLTAEQVEEFVRCSQDPNYFIERYVKIISLDKGFVRIELYPFQKEAITKIMIGQNYLAKELIDQRMWTDIYKHRNQNITLQQAVDHVIMIYKLSKEYKDGI